MSKDRYVGVAWVDRKGNRKWSLNLDVLMDMAHEECFEIRVKEIPISNGGDFRKPSIALIRDEEGMKIIIEKHEKWKEENGGMC